MQAWKGESYDLLSFMYVCGNKIIVIVVIVIVVIVNVELSDFECTWDRFQEVLRNSIRNVNWEIALSKSLNNLPGTNKLIITSSEFLQCR